MQPGTLLSAAKRDNSGALIATLILVGLCAGVLALNWKYLYNAIAGPFPFSAALAADPGPREWVRAEGPLMKTGFIEQTTLRLLKGLAEADAVTAEYLGMLVDGKFLIVKVEKDFSGQIVQGRLVALPESIRSSMPADATYPWLVEEKSYRWSPNLFVMIAGPLFPLMLLALASSIRQAGKVARHPALKRLKRLGPPDLLLPKVEGDLTMAGDQSRVGSIWLTPKWIVVTEPGLVIVPNEDLIGLGHQVTATKTGPEHSIVIWLRGDILTEKLKVTEAQARAVLAKASELYPWAIVPDASEFGKAWFRDSDACERDADARRGASRRPA